MKKKLARIVGVGALSASMLTLGSAFAESTEKSCMMSSKPTATCCTGHKGNMYRMKYMSKSLNLTQDQINKINKIRDGKRAMMKQYWTQMRDLRQEMQSLVRSDEYTQAKARALIDKKSKVLEKLMLLRADTAHQIWLVLDNAQQTKWQSLKSKHEMSNMKGHY